MSTLTLNHPMIGRAVAYKPAAVVAAVMAAADAAGKPAFETDRLQAWMARIWAAANRFGALRAAADLRRLAAQRAGTDPDLSERMLKLARSLEAGEA